MGRKRATSTAAHKSFQHGRRPTRAVPRGRAGASHRWGGTHPSIQAFMEHMLALGSDREPKPPVMMKRREHTCEELGPRRALCDKEWCARCERKDFLPSRWRLLTGSSWRKRVHPSLSSSSWHPAGQCQGDRDFSERGSFQCTDYPRSRAREHSCARVIQGHQDQLT